MNDIKSYLTELILHSLDDEKNIGIKNGIMGKVIRLLDASSSYIKDNSTIQQIAEILLFQIISRFPTISNIYDFDTGLCGVSWGIEYLANRSFLENSPIVFLHELNDKIRSVTANTLTDCELYGVIRYMAAHISNCQQNRQSPAFSHDLLCSIFKESQTRCYSETDLHDLLFLRYAITGKPLPKYKFNTSFISV
jgi:hypothetical protein